MAQAAIDHAIEEAKMAVRELGNNTKAAVRDAAVGRIERMAGSTSEATKYLGSTTFNTIKQNPGPAAVAAIGLGWLMLNGKRGTAATQPTSSAKPYGTTGSTGTDHPVADKAQEAAGKAQEVAGNAVDQVQCGIGVAADQVQIVATGAASQVGDTVMSIANKAQHTQGRIRQMVQESPDAMGIVAAAVGSVAALSISETRREQELLGEARDTLVQQVQTSAQSTMEKVQNVASEVGETIERETKGEGASMGGK